MPERMASIETRVSAIELNTAEIKDDVKALLAWRDEERGARAQRQVDWKKAGTGLTVLTIIINILFNAPGV
jgi:hypothetical protein